MDNSMEDEQSAKKEKAPDNSIFVDEYNEGGNYQEPDLLADILGEEDKINEREIEER